MSNTSLQFKEFKDIDGKKDDKNYFKDLVLFDHVSNNSSQVFIDTYLLSEVAKKPLGCYISRDEFISQAKLFIDDKQLWISDASELSEKKDDKYRLIEIPDHIKKELKIEINHKVTMQFKDFVNIMIKKGIN